MRIERVYVRFYKAFNFDYLRKFASGYEPDQWDQIGEINQPYVRVPLEPDLTTVVGANESGKSQLLEAIRLGITGEGLSRADFCRYSTYFAVEEDRLRLPDFGMQFGSLTSEQAAEVMEAAGAEGDPWNRFWLFRENGLLSVFGDADRQRIVLEGKPAEALAEVLPRVVTIRPDVPLPDSVPLRYLLGDPRDRRLHRNAMSSLVDAIEAHGEWLGSAQSLAQAASHLFAAVGGASALREETERIETSYALARKLLFDVARVAPEAISDLRGAIRDEREGYASAILEEMNAAVGKQLNLRRWWTQDRDFQLVVSAHQEDLILTVRDRTGSQYSFNERSTGLKYFLSYLVQFMAHAPEGDRDDVLLMDEPDAYLSSQGQSDLLRIFSEFARPTVIDRPPSQVVYVTHSPFLIDRNHAERVRVLDKGEGDEGTRVVRDVAQNHYEPLRSSFGAFVAETSFIGTANLFVEGQADQVLLAGMANVTRDDGSSPSETLDLNNLTIVPAGSASEIPYLVFLARGRGIDRPACVVLLDSDAAGDEARKRLLKKPVGRGRTIESNYVVQIGSIGGVQAADGLAAVREIEDLIPVSIAAEAARRYASDVSMVSASKINLLNDGEVERFISGGSLISALRAAIADVWGSEAHIEKVGFARHVLDVVRDPEVLREPTEQLVANFRVLFVELGSRLRAAAKERMDQRLAARIERVKANFLTDNPLASTREAGRLLLEEVEGVLDDSNESTDIRAAVEKLRRQHGLDVDLARPIDDYEQFRADLDGLRYAGQLAQLVSERDVESVVSSAVAVETLASPPADPVEDGALNEGPESSA